jgi:hypothetical protein
MVKNLSLKLQRAFVHPAEAALSQSGPDIQAKCQILWEQIIVNIAAINSRLQQQQQQIALPVAACHMLTCQSLCINSLKFKGPSEGLILQFPDAVNVE